MDTSDAQRLILLFILKKTKQRRKKKRNIWCLEHFVLRATCGEYIRTFRSLLDNRDEALFSYKDDIIITQRTSGISPTTVTTRGC